MTKIRVWDALKDPPGFVGPLKLETALSLGMPVHPGSCDWDVEFSTGEKSRNDIEIFEGDIVVETEDTMPHIVRFGKKWVPFEDSRDGVDDIGGEVHGFYLEPVAKTNKCHMCRPLMAEECNVLGNIHENQDLLEECKDDICAIHWAGGRG